jgi:predicted Zn-dependent peptidase
MRPTAGRLQPPRTPAIAEMEMPGGMRAMAVRRPSIPVVELRLAIPAPPAVLLKPAGALVLSKSLFAGTERRDRAELAEAFERLGGGLDATLDGDSLTLAGSVLADRFAPYIELVAEVLTSAGYRAEEVVGDRERTANEIVIALSQPEVIADEALNGLLYPGHPYGTGIPSPATVGRVSAKSLRQLHDTLIRPASACLVLVGDLRPATALARAQDALGGWLAGKKAAQAKLAPLPQLKTGALELVARPGSFQSNIRLGGSAPPRTADDWPAAALASFIAGGMFTSRLVENLREQHGYTYSPSCYFRHRRAGSRLLIAADVGREVTAPALVETRYELGRIASTGITEAELDAAGTFGVGRFLFQTATQAGLADTLAALVTTGTEPGYLGSYPRSLLRATKKQVDEAARRYFGPGVLLTVVVGDREGVAEPLAALGEVARRAG